MATQGGPAQPVSVVTSGPVEGGAAIPVAVVTDGRAVVGGPAQRVVVVTSGPVQGGPARPIVAAPSGAVVQGGPAIRVYVVSGSLNPTPTYTDKVKALNPIAYWPLADVSGSVATDESGNGRNGTYSNVTLGVPGIGDGRTAAAFDGSTSFVNVYSASLSGAFLPDLGTFAIWLQVANVGVWTDTAFRAAMSFETTGGTQFYIQRDSTNNRIQVGRFSGASVNLNGLSSTGWLHVAITWSVAANQFIAYLNGAAVGSPVAIVTKTAGLNSARTRIGSYSASPFQGWSGSLAHPAVFATALTAPQIASLAVVS